MEEVVILHVTYKNTERALAQLLSEFITAPDELRFAQCIELFDKTIALRLRAANLLGGGDAGHMIFINNLLLEREEFIAAWEGNRDFVAQFDIFPCMYYNVTGRDYSGLFKKRNNKLYYMQGGRCRKYVV